jgi:signal peptide peptidase SppA
MLAMPKLYDVPWAILPEALESYIEEAKNIQAIETRARPSKEKKISVAWLPLYGPISQKPDGWMELFGGTSTEEFGAVFDSMVADSSISAVLIEVDSPGGSVYGVHELSEKIFNARGKKPVIAAVNSLAASAAYHIASAADEIIVTPSGEVGSVGVFAMHTDVSEHEKQMGVRRTFVKAGKYKVEGNPYEPLESEAQKAMQSRVNEYYDVMTSDIGKNRGVTQLDVKRHFAEGRVVGAEDAIGRGMADQVGTLESVIKRLSTKRTKRTMKMRAEIQRIRINV